LGFNGTFSTNRLYCAFKKGIGITFTYIAPKAVNAAAAALYVTDDGGRAVYRL